MALSLPACTESDLKPTVAGATDLGMFSLTTIIPDEQYVSPHTYDDVPSIVYSNVSGDIAVIFSAILNISCLALITVKTRYGLLAPTGTASIHKLTVFRQLKLLVTPVRRRLSDTHVGAILLLLISCELVYCVFWVGQAVILWKDVPHADLRSIGLS